MIARSVLGPCLVIGLTACYPGRSVDSNTEFASVTTLKDKEATFTTVTEYALPDTVLYVPKAVDGKEVPAATQAGYPADAPHQPQRARMDGSRQCQDDAGRRVRRRRRYHRDERLLGIRLVGLLGLVPVLAHGLGSVHQLVLPGILVPVQLLHGNGHGGNGRRESASH